MRPVPKSVTIGGKRIRIRVVPDMEDWGQYHHDLAEIHISARSTEKLSSLKSTLRHEIMHAALSISGVGFMTEFSEEATVRCFDEIFFPAWDALYVRLNTEKP